MKDSENPKDFSPSDFMRARRPKLFSDSKTVNESFLTRLVFEYHLETLTNRKQENEFEHFCRALLEKEICPNLMPQTGPTGGGDGKTDTETYPVADEIAVRWLVGQQANKERWAFAFSAKKDWRAKVNSDVKKIANTNRGYEKIFFVTNQFAEAKKRHELQDALQTKYGIPVTIFDRTWIADCVFNHKREQLAIETLCLTGFSKVETKSGSRDVERENDLNELEKQIDDPSRYQGLDYQLAEDCLRTALLARGLERPRTEIDSRFDRAQRIASNAQHNQQRLRIAYARAWTTFWWYDDFDEFNRLYDQIEELAIGTYQTHDLELLSNLWSVLHTTVSQGKLDAKSAKLVERTRKLKADFGRLAADTTRPNNALLARTHELLMDLKAELDRKNKSATSVFIELKNVLGKTDGLLEFPFESIAAVIRECGFFFTESTAYDDLFDEIVILTQKRTSEGAAGRLFCERGFQKLRVEMIYEAIRLFGLAQQKLGREEDHAHFISSMAGCSLAYESAGLLWAARANMLLATNQALRENVEIVPASLKYVEKLVWLELQLGRIFHALAWIGLSSTLAHHLMLEGDKKQEYENERKQQDMVMGVLLLKTDFWELKHLDFLPEVLEQMGLDHSWMILLYALGYEDYLRDEKIFPEGQTSESTRDFFAKLLEQPAAEDIPNQPELYRNQNVILHSVILGCNVNIEAANNPTSIRFAETVLGALEAFLATSMGSLMPHRAELKIVIHPSDFIKELPQYDINAVSENNAISVRHASVFENRSIEDRKKFQSWLLEFILKIVPQFAVIKDLKSFEEKIIRDELGIGRALNFSDSSIALENIFGKTPNLSLETWRVSSKKSFPLQRKLPWNHTLKKTNFHDAKTSQPSEKNESRTATSDLRHTEIKVVSFINIPLWEEAQWQATAFIRALDSIEPPVLILCFKNSKSAKLIFDEWGNKLGKYDEQDRLRISFVTGTNRNHPADYRVIVSANLDTMNGYGGVKQLVIIPRINSMNPKDSGNLTGFLEMYKNAGEYWIAPGLFSQGKIEPYLEFSIKKKKLYARSAWEIGEQDTDVHGIIQGDNPIIPDGITNAPVTQVLKRFEKNNKKASS